MRKVDVKDVMLGLTPVVQTVLKKAVEMVALMDVISVGWKVATKELMALKKVANLACARVLMMAA